jgi:hypothetical protein
MDETLWEQLSRLNNSERPLWDANDYWPLLATSSRAVFAVSEQYVLKLDQNGGDQNFNEAFLGRQRELWPAVAKIILIGRHYRWILVERLVHDRDLLAQYIPGLLDVCGLFGPDWENAIRLLFGPKYRIGDGAGYRLDQWGLRDGVPVLLDMGIHSAMNSPLHYRGYFDV